MEDNPIRHSLGRLISFLVLSCAAGIFTGAAIFLFKYCANFILSLSDSVYQTVRNQPVLLAVLIPGVALLGLVMVLLQRLAPDCKGGGIPTSIILLRGQMDFRWLRTVLTLVPCALISFFCGVPLGNEGPSVQMGAATGRATVRLLAKRVPAWDRYIMTGSCSAGFAAATGAPISGIFFAFEEVHRRFSPMIFMTAAMTVISSTATMHFLCKLTGIGYSLFHFHLEHELPLSYLWSAFAVGLVCALGAFVFTKTYEKVHGIFKHRWSKIPSAVKIPLLFALVALIGFFLPSSVGTGHGLIDRLVEGQGIWYLLLLAFAVRSLLLIVANNSDVTGGLFVPTLALGALLGALCARLFIALGILPSQHYLLMIVIGISAFMSATSRTPIIALTFAVEALSGLSNLLPIAMGVTISFILVEALGLIGFTETVIERRLEKSHEGKTARVIEAYYTVQKNSFTDGKELRDIFWPPTCTVLSIRKEGKRHHGQQMDAGDKLHLRYLSYDPEKTAKELEALLGQQSAHAVASKVSEGQRVPEL